MAHILVVDDEPVLLALISATLRLDGHTVHAMSDPIEALKFAGSDRPHIDLLVTDISMKPISGFEMVKRLTANGFVSPVLFTSGFSALSTAVANTLGDRSILEKPFTAAELRSSVHRALATKLPHFLVA